MTETDFCICISNKGTFLVLKIGMNHCDLELNWYLTRTVAYYKISQSIILKSKIYY